jgi:hypothetical protein
MTLAMAFANPNPNPNPTAKKLGLSTPQQRITEVIRATCGRVRACSAGALSEQGGLW